MSELQMPAWTIEYVEKWKNNLALCEWVITGALSPHPHQDGTGGTKGEVSWGITTRTATITFRDDLVQAGPDDEDWRQTIIHELLHLRLAPLIAFVIEDLISQLSPQAQEMAKSVFEREHEAFVEIMSAVLLDMEKGIETERGENSAVE